MAGRWYLQSPGPRSKAGKLRASLKSQRSYDDIENMGSVFFEGDSTLPPDATPGRTSTFPSAPGTPWTPERTPRYSNPMTGEDLATTSSPATLRRSGPTPAKSLSRSSREDHAAPFKAMSPNDVVRKAVGSAKVEAVRERVGEVESIVSQLEIRIQRKDEEIERLNSLVDEKATLSKQMIHRANVEAAQRQAVEKELIETKGGLRRKDEFRDSDLKKVSELSMQLSKQRELTERCKHDLQQEIERRESAEAELKRYQMQATNGFRKKLEERVKDKEEQVSLEDKLRQNKLTNAEMKQLYESERKMREALEEANARISGLLATEKELRKRAEQDAKQAQRNWGSVANGNADIMFTAPTGVVLECKVLRSRAPEKSDPFVKDLDTKSLVWTGEPFQGKQWGFQGTKITATPNPPLEHNFGIKTNRMIDLDVGEEKSSLFCRVIGEEDEDDMQSPQTQAAKELDSARIALQWGIVSPERLDPTTRKLITQKADTSTLRDYRGFSPLPSPVSGMSSSRLPSARSGLSQTQPGGETSLTKRLDEEPTPRDEFLQGSGIGEGVIPTNLAALSRRMKREARSRSPVLARSPYAFSSVNQEIEKTLQINRSSTTRHILSEEEHERGKSPLKDADYVHFEKDGKQTFCRLVDVQKAMVPPVLETARAIISP